MSLICSNTKPPVETEPSKPKPFNKKQLTLIEHRAAQKHRYMRALRKLGETGQIEQVLSKSQRVAQIEEIAANSMGDIIRLSPDVFNRNEAWFASKLNWKRNPLNVSTNFNPSGEVRTALMDTKRVSENLLETAGKYNMMNELNKVQKMFKQFSAELKLDPAIIEQALNETIEIGSIPKNNHAYGNSDGVRLINGNRYNEYVASMTDLGFKPDDIKMLRDAASTVHNMFDEVRLTSEALGHNIEALENLGYFPRITSRDFQLRLRRELKTDTALADVIMSAGVEEVKALNPLSSIWQKSRKFNYFVPSDFELVGKLLDTPTEKIVELLGEPKEWVEFLSTKLDGGQLDTLVDSGVFDKLPMTSREVFDYFVDEYKLPYKHVNEMFKQNPSEAVTEYVSRLKKSVGNSSMLNLIARDGINAGWALTSKQLGSLTEDFRANFVPLKFQNIEQFLTPEQIKAAEGIYVHRVVADQWKSILSISVNPVKLSNVARSWHYLASFLNKSQLLSRNILYVGQNFLSGAIMTHAAGANLATVPHATMDMLNYWKSGVESLSNTGQFAKLEGKWLTKREFFTQFMLLRGSDAVPGAANINSIGSRLDALNPRNTKRALEYLFNYANVFKDPVNGVKDGAAYLGSLLNAANSEAFAPFAQMATFVDTVMKWNAAQSLVERSGSAQIANNISRAATLEPIHSFGKTFDNWKDLTRHIDEYFYTFDDPGTLTFNVGKYIRPFAGWAMTSPPAVLRHVLRKPQKFIAYSRLLQLYNYSNDGDLPQAGLTDWQDDEYFVSMRKDVVAGGGVMALFPNGYDPLTDFVNFSSNVDKGVNSIAFGGKGTNERNDRKKLMGEDGVQNILKDLFNTSYYAKPVSILTGVDGFTGEVRNNSKANSYVGVSIPPLVEAVLGMYAPIDALNRANPIDLFGRKEYVDAFGKVVVPRKDSFLGAPRTNSDAVSLAWENAKPSERLLMALGAKVRIIDTARNIQMTVGELAKTLTDIKRSNIKEQQDLTNSKSSISESQFNERQKILMTRIEAEYQLRTDLLRVQQYAQSQGIPPAKVFDELRQRNNAVSDLPLVGSEQRLRLLNELDERINEVK